MAESAASRSSSWSSLKKPLLAGVEFPTDAPACVVLANVVTEMATVAHGFEVIGPRAVRFSAEVRDREHHAAEGKHRRPAVDLEAPPRAAQRMQAALPHTFALLQALPVPRSPEHPPPQRRPFPRISTSHIR